MLTAPSLLVSKRQPCQRSGGECKPSIVTPRKSRSKRTTWQHDNTHTHTHKELPIGRNAGPRGYRRFPTVLIHYFADVSTRHLGYVMRGPGSGAVQVARLMLQQVSLGSATKDRNTLTCRSWPHSHCCYLAPTLLL